MAEVVTQDAARAQEQAQAVRRRAHRVVRDAGTNPPVALPPRRVANPIARPRRFAAVKDQVMLCAKSQ